SSARAPASRTAAASSCVACPAPGNCWRSIATARGRDRPRQSWYRCRRPAVGPRCAVRTAPWRRSPGAHRGLSAGWPASLQLPVADEQRCVEPQRSLRRHPNGEIASVAPLPALAAGPPPRRFPGCLQRRAGRMLGRQKTKPEQLKLVQLRNLLRGGHVLTEQTAALKLRKRRRRFHVSLRVPLHAAELDNHPVNTGP